jgi:hypothetical protein
VQRAAGFLARSLFAKAFRNRSVLVAWLATPIVREREQPVHASAWLVERARQRDRVAQRVRAAARSGASLVDALVATRQAVERTLVPAATATLRRRTPRSTAALLEAVGTPLPRFVPDIGVVDALRALVHALLLEPIRLVFVAAGRESPSLRVHLFGTSRALGHVFIASPHLDAHECRVIEYLALAADHWIDDGSDSVVDDAVAAASDASTLVASSLVNDAFDVALDRVALVWALCETILHGAGEYEAHRHVLAAALTAEAGAADAIAAGYYTALRALADSVRCAPLVPATRSAARFSPAAQAAAAEYAARYRIG